MSDQTFHPEAIRHELLIQATSPISHHDAAVQDDSNRNLFNRQVVLLGTDLHDAPVANHDDASDFARTFTVPESLRPLFFDFSFPEFAACAFLKHFADEFNSSEGSGLFSGMERWPTLGVRASHAAYAGSLRSAWSRLCRSMQVELQAHASTKNTAFFELISLPLGTQLDILDILRTESTHLVRIAQVWHSKIREWERFTKAKESAKESTREFLDDPALALENLTEILWEHHQLRPNLGRQRRLDIPHITSNSIRHQMLREPSMNHLFSALGVLPESLPAGVEALFYNGGNIAAGSASVPNSSLLARKIRDTFPSLDLLGGVANSFDLGESFVSVHSHLVCRETAPFLPDWIAESSHMCDVSAFDMLEDFTLTRHATEGREGTLKDRGQMVFSFEGLSVGAQIAVTLTFKNYTPVLARGAAAAALKSWQRAPVLGGASARGFGKVSIKDQVCLGDDHEATEALETYEAYLSENREELIEELTNGKLGSGKVIIK